MRQLMAFVVVFAGGLALAAPSAAAGNSYVDYADVINVEPVYTTVRVSSPRRECWEETVHPAHGYGRGRHSYTPMIVGGIVGGVVGNQFGSGRGKDLMTAAGVVLGGSIGRDVAHRHRPRYGHPVVETRCRTDYDYHEEERVDGYRVEYRYQGRTYVTRMGHDPGERIRVHVDVSPVR